MSSAIGILGGTFDPVHYGHLRAASEVREKLGFEELRLVPAGDPPHRGAPEANAMHRVKMLELAMPEFPGLAIDTREISRPGKSYTVLTLEELRAERPGTPIALVLGADAFVGLPTWHRWQELFDLAHIVVVSRPGTTIEGSLPLVLDAAWHVRRTRDLGKLENARGGAIFELQVTPQPIASTAIRRALAQGAAGRAEVQGLLPPAVLAYIDHHQLYRPGPDVN